MKRIYIKQATKQLISYLDLTIESSKTKHLAIVPDESSYSIISYNSITRIVDSIVKRPKLQIQRFRNAKDSYDSLILPDNLTEYQQVVDEVNEYLRIRKQARMITKSLFS